MLRPTILTIGHSTHSLAHMVGLLKAHGVTAVADVRSSPFSRTMPEMSRHALVRGLKAAGIEYTFLGDELGGRSKFAGDYDDDGRVRYDRMARSASFARGLDRVLDGAKHYAIALLCAEKEPLECHRSLLIARPLEQRGATVAHIHPDGHVEPNGDAMKRLLGLHGMQEEALFASREELIERACALQAKRFAYVDAQVRRQAITTQS